MAVEDQASFSHTVPVATGPSSTLRTPANAFKNEVQSQGTSSSPAPSIPTFTESPINRAAQLDSSFLDTELFSIFNNSVKNALAKFESNVYNDYEPEFLLLLKSILSLATLYSTSGDVGAATYGAQLQNLKYIRLTKSLKAKHYLLHILLPYFHTRLSTHATDKGWSDSPTESLQHRIWKLLNSCSRWYTVLNLLNFLAFLFNGQYATIWDRLLGLRMTYARRETTRRVSFEFMNRQLVWHTVTDFLLFALPTLPLSSLKRFFLPSSPHASLPKHLCAICFNSTNDYITSNITIPYETDCGHTYCYYCITNERSKDEKWRCLRCGKAVKKIIRSTKRIARVTEESNEVGQDESVHNNK